MSVESSPRHQPVGNVGGQVSEGIGSDDRLLERHIDLPDGIQIAPSVAVHIGTVELNIRGRPVVKSELKPLIAGDTGVREYKGGGAVGVNGWPYDELRNGAAVEKAEAQRHVRAEL